MFLWYPLIDICIHLYVEFIADVTRIHTTTNTGSSVSLRVQVPPTNATLLMATTGIKPTPLPGNPNAQDWQYFRDRFDDYLIFADLQSASEEKKKALLLITIGRQGTDILTGLPEPGNYRCTGKNSNSTLLTTVGLFLAVVSNIIVRKPSDFHVMNKEFHMLVII